MQKINLSPSHTVKISKLSNATKWRENSDAWKVCEKNPLCISVAGSSRKLVIISLVSSCYCFGASSPVPGSRSVRMIEKASGRQAGWAASGRQAGSAASRIRERKPDPTRRPPVFSILHWQTEPGTGYGARGIASGICSIILSSPKVLRHSCETFRELLADPIYEPR